MSLPRGRTTLSGTVYITGTMHACGEHVIINGTTGPATMVRMAKRDRLELWGVTPMWHAPAIDRCAALTPNLYWIVEVQQHADYFAGHIRDVALIYPGDYRAMQAFMQQLRTQHNQERAVGEC